MALTKTALTADPESRVFFEKYWPNRIPRNPSRTVNRIVGRYHQILKENPPRLECAEWGAVADIVVMLDEDDRQELAWARTLMIKGLFEYPDIVEKWRIDAEKLGNKLIGMNLAQVAAIIENSERHLEFRATGQDLPYLSDPMMDDF